MKSLLKWYETVRPFACSRELYAMKKKISSITLTVTVKQCKRSQRDSKNIFFVQKMQAFFQILAFLVSTSSIVRGSNEPLMDILNNYDKLTNVSELCQWHLSVLNDGIESDEIWALKGEQSINCCL